MVNFSIKAVNHNGDVLKYSDTGKDNSYSTVLKVIRNAEDYFKNMKFSPYRLDISDDALSDGVVHYSFTNWVGY